LLFSFIVFFVLFVFPIKRHVVLPVLSDPELYKVSRNNQTAFLLSENSVKPLRLLPLLFSPRRPDQLTLSLTAVRDSTVSSRPGRGLAGWGTMSLNSTASGSGRSLPGTGPSPAAPGGAEGLGPPFDPLPEAGSAAIAPPSRFGGGFPRPARAVLRSWGCSLWFC